MCCLNLLGLLVKRANLGLRNQRTAAMLKDGWVITDDPYYIEYKGLRLYADLGAEKPLAAEKGEKRSLSKLKSLVHLRKLQS